MTQKSIVRYLPQAFRTVLTLMVASTAMMAQTGGGATLVGTVKDSTGSVVGQAKVTVINTANNFTTETTTAADGGYYVPYLTPGDYRVKVSAAGFKEFVREGLSMRSAEVPRVDIVLELGAVTESITVSASASLVSTETVVSSYVVAADVLTEAPGVMKRTLYLMQYMPGIVAVLGQAGFHIMGQAQNDIGASMDGIAAKSPYTGTVNQVDGVVQGSTDAMEEVRVLTTGVSAEYGHTAGGSMKMVYKSGGNSLHMSFEDRFLPGSWTHRAYLTQVPLPPSAPWYYETFDLVASGPVVIPKIYNGRNKTFWLSDYAINHEHTINLSVGTVPTPDMLNGDFSFKDAAGGGLPIYNPFSTRLVGSTWTRDPLPGNIVPKNLFDPVASKFLALGIWNLPNMPGTPSRTGPSNNLQFVNTCRCLHRDRWDEKIDHQFSSNEKIFGRYSHYHNRGQNGDNFARPEFNASREINPTDDINGVISFTSIISRVMFNEFRIGYNRRASSNPARPDAARDALTIPGVAPETFPYFNIGYSIAALNYTRQVGEDKVLQDNVTRIAGRHSLKFGYEMIRTSYSDKPGSLPSGQYNFTGGTSLPFTPNTGIDFAAFEMGVVTSATFTKQLAIFLPRLWDQELYFQDDWKVLPTLSLNLGVRWSYFSPYETKYDQQSQFDPTVVDPVTGRLGAITHPKGPIGKRDLNNFQPRLGLAWNFNPKWVFRSSFGIMTVDSSGQGGFDEYAGAFNILQPTGDPRHLFQLGNGPGPIQYTVNADGTVPYTGASFGSRNATWRDPNLRNAYIMNWSGGFQYQLRSNWLLSALYQGTAGVALQRSWNINQVPTSIALGTDRALQDQVFAAQQNYLLYPQFGSVNLLSNFNHNTWHSGNFSVEKRYSRGLTLNATFNLSKSLSNDDSLNYYTRSGKARTAYDQEKSFGAFVIYELPVGRGKRFMNRGGLANTIFGGWKVNLSENALSGIPLSVTQSGSPYKYLIAGNRVDVLTTLDQAKVPNWDMGNRFPTAAQTPYFNLSSFAYPAPYTIGNLGSRVLDAPAILWMQFFVTKSWFLHDERLKLSLRLDGHNLPWKRPQLSAPNTTYNLNNTAAWGRFTGTIGDFSNYGTAQANVQMSFRAEF
jgi:Carboxypeptidase regulatory-like domain/TonB dependent receptor